VSALVYVTLGRRLLVWGGHPAITPMIWVVASDVGVDYGRWVRLYQSRHFEEEYPEDNEQFNNVSYVDEVEADREKSLLAMRERMFSEHQFSAAVFMGGMGGIIDEFELFSRLQPNAAIIPVVSTGGATLDVAERCGPLPDDLSQDLDYVALMHRHLRIPVQENRFFRPEDQPRRLDQRLWHPSAP
jgi:SLOG cluster3 family